tara:strand:+ start:3816 stop:4355 length:540 start_codon:yes stop_codon:yes gene_type:complete
MATITTPDLPNPESKTNNRDSPYDSPTSTFYDDLITAYEGESLRRGTSTGLSSDPTIQELRNRLNNDLNNGIDAAKISMDLVFEEMRTQMSFLINAFPLVEMERQGGRVQHTPPPEPSRKSTLNPKARSPSQLVVERIMDTELKELRREQEQLKLEQELEQNRRNTSDQQDDGERKLRM